MFDEIDLPTYLPIQWKKGWNKDIFLKKTYIGATWSFYINLVQQRINRHWVDNVEVIHCKKLDIEDEDLCLMIPELYTSVFHALE